MKHFSTCIVALSLATAAMAFAPVNTRSSSTALKAEQGMPERKWNQMVVANERSASVPFLPRATALDGTAPGDYGFDPFFLSSIPKNFAGFLQPPSWEETPGIPTIYWMREAELKNGRVAMLAVVGWIATDFGLRFPFEQFSTDSIPSAYLAHNTLVQQGAMTVLLLAIGLVEFCTGAVLVEVSKGEIEDREPGDYKFDGGFFNGKDEKFVHDMKTKEVNNGRLAMLAFGGIATQTALGYSSFPYF